MAGYRVPIATYRLQFSQHFTFNDARTLVPYLHRLGISDLYASPIFQARSGSAHGYDVTDPTRLNPELGTEADFDALVQELKAHGMGLLLDVVTNHMAASPENPWWVDVLENGPSSPYSGFFDVDWKPAAGIFENQLVLPILGKPYHEVLESGELVVSLDEAGLNVRYYDYRLPLEVKSYGFFLSHLIEVLQSKVGVDHPYLSQMQGIIAATQNLPPYDATGPQDIQARRQSAQQIKQQLLDLASNTPVISQLLDHTLAIFNGKAGEPASFNHLHQLLSRQPYRLHYWKTGREIINYRRFFDIAELGGVRVEDPQVFEETHSLALRLARAGKVNGLRLDHIDGLYDPDRYLQRLQDALPTGSPGSGQNFYVVVEKILSHDEFLPPDWPIAGTTGYDYLNALNGVFVSREGFAALVDGYHRIIGSAPPFGDVVYANKKRAIDELFGPELRRLGQSLAKLAGPDRYACDLPNGELTRALSEVTACLPIYRTYNHGNTVSVPDQEYISQAVAEARRRCPELDGRALNFVGQVALGKYPAGSTAEQQENWGRFVAQWRQFTGPVMAKGLEDTSLYSYNPLISLNEVGGSPTTERLSVEAFHQHNARQQRDWPHSLNATASHDTKRSEDVRARINVLSEIPEEWTRRLRRWISWNRSSKRAVAEQLLPDVNLEVLLYQTLIGAWPLATAEVPQFRERLKQYLIKAAREAKTHTSWISPNAEYENSMVQFVESILEDSGDNRFLTDFLKFQRRMAYYGALNSLAQVLLKITSPGVPDFYQGRELWDFSLVDPDNRRPVNFEKPARLLDDLQGQETQELESTLKDLLCSWQDGRAKLYVTYQGLQIRAELQELFEEGEYIPLQASGNRKEQVCAFARRLGGTWAVIAVPRLSARMVSANRVQLGIRAWKEDSLRLPESTPNNWRNIFTGDRVSIVPGSDELPLHTVFKRCPVALLVGST